MVLFDNLRGDLRGNAGDELCGELRRDQSPNLVKSQAINEQAKTHA